MGMNHVNNTMNSPQGVYIQEFDNQWDGTLDAAYWSMSNSRVTGAEANGQYRMDGSSSNNSGSLTLTGNMDLRYILSKRKMTVIGSWFAKGVRSTTSGGAASATYILRLTDGTNNRDLVNVSVNSGSQALGNGSSGGSIIATLTLNGTSLNIRITNGCSASNGGTSSSSTTTLCADNTNLDISAWTSLKLLMSGSEGGGNASTGAIMGSVGPIFATDTVVGSKKTI